MIATPTPVPDSGWAKYAAASFPSDAVSWNLPLRATSLVRRGDAGGAARWSSHIVGQRQRARLEDAPVDRRHVEKLYEAVADSVEPPRTANGERVVDLGPALCLLGERSALRVPPCQRGLDVAGAVEHPNEGVRVRQAHARAEAERGRQRMGRVTEEDEAALRPGRTAHERIEVAHASRGLDTLEESRRQPG